MFNNPMGGGFPGVQPQQFNGVQPQMMPVRKNTLTDEELKKLSGEKQQFNLALTEKEHLKAVCNHIGQDGRDMLEQDPMNPNGVICKICGYSFEPIASEAPIEYVKEKSQEYINILQTIKLMFVDMPTDVSRTFFDTIGLAMKTPELFELASKNLAKYDNYNPYGNNYQSTSAMGLLSYFMNSMGQGGFGFQAQPVYQQPQMQGFQQPQMQGFQQNPFGYPGASQFGQPMGGYQPQMQGFQYNPMQQAAPAAPTAAPEAQPAAENTTTETVNVQA